MPYGKSEAIVKEKGHYIDSYTMYKASVLMKYKPEKNFYNLDTLTQTPSPDTSYNMLISPYLYTPQNSLFLKFLPVKSVQGFVACILYTEWLARLLSFSLLFLLLFYRNRLKGNILSRRGNSESAEIKLPLLTLQPGFCDFAAIALFALSMHNVPYRSNAYFTQVSGFMSVLVFGAYTASRFGRQFWARILLFLAGVIKIYPWFLALFIIKINWRSYAKYAATGIVLSAIMMLFKVFSFETIYRYLEPKTGKTAGELRWIFTYLPNSGLYSEFLHLNLSGQTPDFIISIIYCSTILALLIAFPILALSRLKTLPDNAGHILFAIACLLFMQSVWPVIWVYHYMMMVPFLCLSVAEKKMPLAIRIASALYAAMLFNGEWLLGWETRFFVSYRWINDINALVALTGITALHYEKKNGKTGLVLNTQTRP
ncbi:MAG: glycosyltransferase family 87 protein [Bacteroidota bacterium]